ncbi:hypothetical protein [Sporosarcina sp. FA9]|uniref:hypothetical protein n=1 Tax=Sporosarcina sp. FA9 TaxID=3413030 RepID=UPI003F65A638
MRIRNNERGSALMVVLLLVAVFTLLGMSLLSMNISAAKQFDKIEEQVQARHLAEMGVLHYKAELQKIVTDNNNNIANIVKEHISAGKSIEELKYLLDNKFSVFCKEISNSEFVISETKPPITGIYSTNNISDNEKDRCETIEKDVIVSFKSIGNSGNYEEFINAAITIISSGLIIHPLESGDNDGSENDNTVTKLGPFGTIYTNPITVMGDQSLDNKDNYTFKDAVIFEKNLTLSTAGGNKYTPVIDAEKDLYVGGKLTLSNHNKINVGGDLTIVNSLKIGNNSCIAVNGKLSSKEASLGNNSVLVIYGNGYFDKKPSGGSIYIRGKLIVGGKEVVNTYNIESYKGGKCKNSDEFSNYDSSDYQAKISWDIAENLDATYNE